MNVRGRDIDSFVNEAQTVLERDVKIPAMRMNYAYAVEFVEVDPLTLGTETLGGDTSSDKAEILKNIAVDKSRTLGLHGTAILSRFPLRNVRVARFTHQGHDWYVDEKKVRQKLRRQNARARRLCLAKRFARGPTRQSNDVVG